MTRETLDLFLLFYALFWSAVYITRHRMGNPPKWFAALEAAGCFCLVIFGSWSLMVVFPGETPRESSWPDAIVAVLGGIGWFAILNRLAKTPFKKIYCKTCWWLVEGKWSFQRVPFDRCINVELGRNPGGWVDDALVKKCLNCGGHRPRAKELSRFLQQ